MPKISVIVPIYNVESYLDNCISSIINQTYRKLEIILVDDGSTDKSGNLCDKYANKDNRIIVIHKKNGGVSEARNTGLKKATGDYISFVDGDDYIHPQMLEVLYTAIEKNPFADFSMIYAQKTYSLTANFESIQIEKIEYKIIQKQKLLINILGRGTNGYQDTIVCNKLYKKQILNNIYFNPNIKFSEDTEYCSRIYLKTNHAILIEKEMYYYFLRADSTIHKDINIDFIKRVEAYYLIYNNIPDSYNKLKAYAVEKIIKSILNIRYHTKKTSKDLKETSHKLLKPIQNEIYPKFLRNKQIEFHRKLGLSIFLYCPPLYNLFIYLCEIKAKYKD